MTRLAAPKLETKLPTSHSERPFAERLSALEFPEDNRPHIWFGRIPRCKDIDCVIWFPKNGLFAIELKSWALSNIIEISSDEIRLQENVHHSTTNTPWQQVRDETFSLKNRLARDPDIRAFPRPIWIASAVSFYNIRRAEFEERFVPKEGTSGESDFRSAVSSATLFCEDLQSWDSFLNRLLSAKRDPLYGEGAKIAAQPQIPDSSLIRALNGVLHPGLIAAREASAYDKERVRVLESQEAKVLDRINWKSPAICTGYVGTGKTILGLQAALQRLQKGGGRGLFLCFNKVLATDIDRLLQLSPIFSSVRLDVFDVFQFLRALARDADVPYVFDSRDPNKSAEQVCAGLFAAWHGDAAWKRRLQYDFVVVDEAQDLREWAWSLVEEVQGPNTEAMVIDAKDQQLYCENKADSLTELIELVRSEEVANYIEKRRVFRTTDTSFLLSQLFVDSYPDPMHARSRWDTFYGPRYHGAKEKTKKGPDSEAMFELARRQGHAPELHYCEAEYPQIVGLVSSLLRKAVQRTALQFREDQPCGVLILVPFQERDGARTPNWNAVARDACLACDFRFIDYSSDEDDIRRRAYSGDEVRISTFHSAKGIEGLHVIVLGFDCLSDVAPTNIGRGVNNLGYVVLSRSQYDTDVVMLGREQPRREAIFLENAIQIVGN
jgi:hypothetical protein